VTGKLENLNELLLYLSCPSLAYLLSEGKGKKTQDFNPWKKKVEVRRS